jgi:8-oxo-dGTP pyrophosphatase MutT (NUDIX family)
VTAADGPWPDPGPGVVRAAGGIVHREVRTDGSTGGGVSRVEVLVVHRPRYDDWSFPKGKCDPGESFADAARREVHEETGFTCSLGEPWAELHYTDHKGRPKVVRYWSMTAVEGAVEAFVANDEVDEVRWLAIDEARDRLSYPHDAGLLDRLAPT